MRLASPLSQHPGIQHETHCRDRHRLPFARFRGRGASSLRDRHLLRRERPPVRKPHGFRGEVQLRRHDGRTPDAAVRHGTGGPERRPVDPGHGDGSRSVHRCVPGSIARGCERARLPLHSSPCERDGGANGIRRDRCGGSSPSTRRRCGSDAAVRPADGGRHESGGNVRILNGHGSCSAPPPSLQGWPVQPILLTLRGIEAEQCRSQADLGSADTQRLIDADSGCGTAPLAVQPSLGARLNNHFLVVCPHHHNLAAIVIRQRLCKSVDPVSFCLRL